MITDHLSRRAWFQRTATGVQATALTWLLHQEGLGLAESSSPTQNVPAYHLQPRPTHHTPRANAMIHLFMNGGPSQMDLFDPKPVLNRHHGEDYFENISGEVENPEAAGKLMRSPFTFK